MIESPIYREILEEGKSKGRVEGRAEGEAEGMRKGEAEGARKAKLETARAMLARGMDMETVLEITGLDRESLEGSPEAG
ncbi:MAG: Rpn family recombination-promoting nuclease/putative transposase [Leptospiraceae bacterium]|nr:Rpn family recombination-promoting nuclease/putative transposase [Leptospiraceae bacterium]